MTTNISEVFNNVLKGARSLPVTTLVDSCVVGMRNQQNLYPKAPSVVAKLLQYSSSRVKLKDGFSSYKMICSYSKW